MLNAVCLHVLEVHFSFCRGRVTVRHVAELVDTDLAVTVSYQDALSLCGKQQGGELHPWVGWAHYGWIQTEERCESTQSDWDGAPDTRV